MPFITVLVKPALFLDPANCTWSLPAACCPAAAAAPKVGHLGSSEQHMRQVTHSTTSVFFMKRKCTGTVKTIADLPYATQWGETV
jgi:hypothetical protein